MNDEEVGSDDVPLLVPGIATSRPSTSFPLIPSTKKPMMFAIGISLLPFGFPSKNASRLNNATGTMRGLLAWYLRSPQIPGAQLPSMLLVDVFHVAFFDRHEILDASCWSGRPCCSA